MRIAIIVFAVLAVGCSTSGVVYEQQLADQGPGSMGELKVEILSPIQDQQLTDGETSFLVEGGASNFGGVRYLDLIFVLDGSQSLVRSDPKDFLSAGATGLVQKLAPDSDIRLGVVSFNTQAHLLMPLTQNRAFVVDALDSLPRSGRTDVAAGIHSALAEFNNHARPNSSRVIMLFTDGKSNERKAREATEEAKAEGVAVHTLLLGSDQDGASMLQEIARGTGGSFVQVRDPAKLPDAFLNLRTTGVESVTLRVNGGESEPTQLSGGSFSRRVILKPGENRIVAEATSLNGDFAQSAVTVNAGPPNCAALDVLAVNNGQPTMSIHQRSVEIVVDGSRSMWGRMDGQPKMAVTQEILQDVSQWFPGELNLALRAYGNTSASELRDCADSELLVAFGEDNRVQIGESIAALRPLGQTPLAYALNQVAEDFGELQGERAVVLVTDGIESCGGDPVAAARRLSQQGIAIHVIGFGMEKAADEDAASLEAIARASGGRFLMAHSAAELKDALVGTVGTPFRVYSGQTVVADGALGSGESILLPDGDYRVQFSSTPSHEVPVSLVAGERVTMTLEKEEGMVFDDQQRQQVGYTPCSAMEAEFTASR